MPEDASLIYGDGRRIANVKFGGRLSISVANFIKDLSIHILHTDLEYKVKAFAR
jgi:hypothetical protein